MPSLPRSRQLGLFLACFLLASGLSMKESLASARRVVLLLVPAVGMGDLNPKQMPNFRALLGKGAVGLMNTRTAGTRWDPDEAADLSVDPARGSAYLTLGAGTRCDAGPSGSEGFLSSEPTGEGQAAAVYLRRNHLSSPEPAVHLDPLMLQDANDGLGYRVDLGALADLLHRNNVQTAVVGEADRPGELHREGILTAMNRRGEVDFARFDTSEELPGAPFGRELSLDDLDQSLAQAFRIAPFVVIDWGDTARLDDLRPMMLPAFAAHAARPAMRHLDDFLGRLTRRLDFSRDVLLLVSPYPSRGARASYDLLTPFLRVGGVRPGLLTSPTTRRIGVAANVDVAPTVADALGLAGLPSSVVGRPVGSLAVARNWDRLLALRSRLLEVEAERRTVLRGVVTFLTCAMAAFALLFGVLKGEGAQWLPPSLGYVPASLPLSLLALAFVQWPSVRGFTLALILSTVVLSMLAAYVSRFRRRKLDGFGFLALATVALVVADGLAGFPHMPYCILSYSLMEGARYYGIGNEYMGAFLAATAMGGTALFTVGRLDAKYKLGVAALFLLATAILAGPAFGAKFGGAVASAGAFGLCLLLLNGRRLRARHILYIGIGILGVIALMILFDQLRGGHSSHVGRAFSAVRERGIGELGLIIQRKASMGFRLLRFSPWSRLMGWALLASLLGLRSRKLRNLPAWPPGPLGAGIAGALAAGVIALLVDDAGALAAATAFIFIPPALAAAEPEPVPERAG